MEQRLPIAILAAVLVAAPCGCGILPETGETETFKAPATFDGIVDFLQEHGDAIVLEGEGGSKAVVSPAFNGRIFTTKVGSIESTGLVNADAIRKGATDPSFNNFGGMDRFWLTPEGGQFSIFFEPTEEFPSGMFDREKWRVPEAIDRGAFEIVRQDDSHVVMSRTMELANYGGTEFRLKVDREVGVIEAAALPGELGVNLPQGVHYVGVYSANTITNTGDTRWRPATGFVGIWILGQFNPSESSVIIGPFRPGSEKELGPRFNDNYFGDLSDEVPDRFKVLGNAVLLRADARREGKFGISQKRSTGLAGAIDFKKGLLTIVKFDVPELPERYANQSWETHQSDPFTGDALQAYNSGPKKKDSGELAPVPFFEVESTSPVRPLGPGEKLVHRHATFQFQGDIVELSTLGRLLLGVELGSVKDTMLR